MLELTMLPARQGDALWIRWGNARKPYQLLIDMGTEEVGGALRERLEALAPNRRNFELLVVTHVDRDHIGGVLTCLAEQESELAGLSFGDVWFNGWTHLSGGKVIAAGNEGPPTLEAFGPAQGERLSTWLRGETWNRAFDGRAVVREANAAPASVRLPGGLTLRVLGPTPERLAEFKPTWQTEVAIALEKGTLSEVSHGLESYGSKTPPDLEDDADLEILADKRSSLDQSPANGSSIALLLEYKDRRIILSGDAFADDLIAGLQALDEPGPMEIDAFKLPHHGSKANVTRELVEAVSCPWWLFSTDGTQFRHPDAQAIARVIRYGSRAKDRPILGFNVPSTYNGWWNNKDWKKRYGYFTNYGTPDEGLTLEF